ncbi:GNAT family N-acetyltransferase [Zavarzinella formosa]|uniref:GNAT family N-acetyltransferase n=1 Tax=Zavarzinella formosa TaxID=360055 RepID=UPI0002E489F2|nr:GNAT family N-acetyltransferase [Zavarzinella formosa]
MNPAATPLPHTPRLRFRNWTADDLPLAIVIWADPQVTRLIADLGNPSVRQARERLLIEMENLTNHGVQYWPVFLSDGTHIGCGGLRPHRPAEGLWEVGIHLLPSFWNNGYATEALRGIIEHAFGPLKAKALFARHHPNNLGSGRVLTKTGFRFTHHELMPQTRLEHPCYLLQAGEITE